MKAQTMQKKEMEEIKKDIDNLVNRLGKLGNKGGEIMSEQFEKLNKAMQDWKETGEKKGEQALNKITSSTRKHPARNLACAFGIGLVLALIIK